MSDVAERVQELEDIEAIRRLQIYYATRLDNRDLRGYTELFAEDGSWHGSSGEATGREDMYNMLVGMLDSEVGREFHVVTNSAVELAGDRATATCTFLVVSRGEDGNPYVRLLGHYDDELVRQDGRWLFSNRVANLDLPATPLF
jgi:uncharacterized protein (TIGR02246 family)